MIYLIECMDYVKIGFTTDIHNRLSQLQVASPLKLKLIGLIEGTIEDEQQLHERFAPLRSSGEWFVITPEIRRFAESLPDTLLWKHGFIPQKLSPIGLIKQARIECGLSMEALADKLGVSKQSIMDMELREIQGRITIKTLSNTLNRIGYKFEFRTTKISEQVENREVHILHAEGSEVCK